MASGRAIHHLLRRKFQSQSSTLCGGQFLAQRENAIPVRVFSKEACEAAHNGDGNLHQTDRQNLMKPFARSGEIDGKTIMDFQRSTRLGFRSPVQFSFGGLYGVRSHSTVTKANENADDIKPKNSLRPLSPHLPVYKPQSNSTRSILNRISACYLSGVSVAYYLIFIKMSEVCMTSGSFHSFVSFSESITPMAVDLAVVAAAYHTYYGITHIVAYFKGH